MTQGLPEIPGLPINTNNDTEFFSAMLCKPSSRPVVSGHQSSSARSWVATEMVRETQPVCLPTPKTSKFILNCSRPKLYEEHLLHIIFGD